MLICCANDDSIDFEQNNHLTNNSNSIIDRRKLARIEAEAAKDDPKYASIINFFAILVIIVCTFFLGFYS